MGWLLLMFVALFGLTSCGGVVEVGGVRGSVAGLELVAHDRNQVFAWNDFSSQDRPLFSEVTDRLDEVIAHLDEVEDQGVIYGGLAELFHSGKGAAIAIDLNTSETVYSFQADRVFTAASTYKLFVAYAILEQLESKRFNRATLIGGVPALACVENMILWSDNDCPGAWLDAIGFSKMQRIARATGADQTSFSPGDIRTTPSNVAGFLTRLYHRELLGNASTEVLIDLMERQVWRERIPAALEPRSVVVNKPGFLDELSHDAAIVYSPKGDFVLVIFTDELGDKAVKGAARLIFDRL